MCQQAGMLEALPAHEDGASARAIAACVLAEAPPDFGADITLIKLADAEVAEMLASKSEFIPFSPTDTRTAIYDPYIQPRRGLGPIVGTVEWVQNPNSNQ